MAGSPLLRGIPWRLRIEERVEPPAFRGVERGLALAVRRAAAEGAGEVEEPLAGQLFAAPVPRRARR